MNWNIEIDNNNKIIIDEATTSNCWEYSGSNNGVPIKGIIAKTRKECVDYLLSEAYGSISTLENMLERTQKRYSALVKELGASNEIQK